HGSRPRLDDGLDERGWTAQTARVRHRAAGAMRRTGCVVRRGRGGMPALRLGEHRAHHRIRLYLLQVALALPQLPRTVRPFQMSLATAETPGPAAPHFHWLGIEDVRRETADAVSIALSVPPELACHYRFRPGQYLTLRTTLYGEEVRRSYSICSGLDD